jgi:hypothetical protein
VPPRTIALPSLGPVVKMSNYYRALDATSRDKRAAKTITAIIAALHAEGHQGSLEQGFIGNRLHGTDTSEFIHARYGSLVKFLQEAAATILWSLSVTKVRVSLIMPPNWCYPDPFV